MPNVNKVKLLSERISGAPLDIFNFDLANAHEALEESSPINSWSFVGERDCSESTTQDTRPTAMR